ncbi:MAG: hypothetical protein Q8N70_10915, partial [Deltaproteobacteria bacterium]|nr:hypothetical protein [Deltaproteobacteria bacterium]
PQGEGDLPGKQFSISVLGSCFEISHLNYILTQKHYTLETILLGETQLNKEPVPFDEARKIS